MIADASTPMAKHFLHCRAVVLLTEVCSDAVCQERSSLVIRSAQTTPHISSPLPRHVPLAEGSHKAVYF